MSKANGKAPTSCPHPMLDVPDVIRIVLRETASLLIRQKRPNERRSVNDDSLLHSVLASAVRMPEPGYPPYRASVMDGYAIRVTDYTDNSTGMKNDGDTWTHAIIDKVFAGDADGNVKNTIQSPVHRELPPAIYVTTGAVVPESFDCVVPIEECVVSDDYAHLVITGNATVAKDKWIRPVGFDILAGTVVLEEGHVLDPVALGLLRQSGCTVIEIKRPVRVGVLSTGNELITSQANWNIQSTSKGLIPDVNRPILLSLLSTYQNCIGIDLGMARDDDIDTMVQLVESQLEHCEIIITTGGISMGESDIVEEVIVNRLGGKLHVGRMNMKPGKPTTFVTIPSKYGTRFVFAMPGNPVSATVCTQLLVRPCLDMMFNGGDMSADTYGESVEEQVHRMVANAVVHPEVQGVLMHDIQLDDGRPEYHRVVVETGLSGRHRVRSTGVQQSSRLLSMRDADGLLVLPKATKDKPKALAGETYSVLLVRDIDIIPKTRLCDSNHISKAQIRDFTVAIILINPESSNTLVSLGERVKAALSGSKSGNVSVGPVRTFSGQPHALFGFLKETESVTCDIHVVVMSEFLGEQMSRHLEFSTELRSKLSKVADAMALQARRGAASRCPVAALFEVVIGYIPDGRGSLVIFMPEQGLDEGLGNVRGLVKHALEIARDIGRND